MKNLTVLGSTGSIGTNTLDVVRRRNDCAVFALVAGKNAALLASQIVEFRPRVAVVATEEVRANLIDRLRATGLARTEWPELEFGAEARVRVAAAGETDFVMSAIVGVAGLAATYEAVRLGKTVGLANKEVLVASGRLVTNAARASGTELIPVDSEHNGVHQCLRAGKRSEVARILLTASGGPFRETPVEELAAVTPTQALNHPTWKMGRRITIDSATMMNKGFEVIEACWLFGLTPAEVDVTIHPQSSVHAMVEYSDGSLIAQISATDMRMPIQYALTYPAREAAPVPRLDWTVSRHWDFSPPDFRKFPLLKLAYEAQKTGGSAACTLNAADEIAVEAFLAGRVSYPGIAEVVEHTLSEVPVSEPRSIDEVLEIDETSRSAARAFVARRAGAGAVRPLVRA
ncbi:MAG TPA: 1-deoxy-D-xylulose-5-phosphate reductoisomerase [Bryobacteraceae bacterium]|nr:1-deoxy-D-xylulose-5-phosphate reductoisomerase [Bryobacteraceae bacterium]